MKLDRLMESVLDTTNPEDNEGAPTNSQPTHEWRPPTRDFGGLERRLARMEDNMAAIHETVKTVKAVVKMLHNQKVRNKIFIIFYVIWPHFLVSNPILFSNLLS